MKKLLPLKPAMLLFAFITTASLGQNWTDVQQKSEERPEIEPSNYRATAYSLSEVQEILNSAEMNGSAVIIVPLPNGSSESFIIHPNNTMSAGLKEKFPEIRTFSGRGLKNNAHTIQLDHTPQGFHAMIDLGTETVYIDPFKRFEEGRVISYRRKDFLAVTTKEAKVGVSEHKCLAGNEKIKTTDLNAKSSSGAKASGTQLRTYKAAITCTGEYSQFHGGTTQGALSAIVTTMNRINGIYEQEVAISFTLVANNDQLIYLNGATDPYDNDDAGSYIDQTHDNITAIIGSPNFDIGHGFSTGAGGLASLGAICNNSRKGSGVTGTNSPIGDPYDVDFVAHEIGHQFGGEHTFNGDAGSCSSNRSGSAAYEPGSGTTIMAYAGICGSSNTQNNSDAFFHTHSFDQIVAHSTEGTGNNCPVITTTGNTPPTVTVPSGGFTIPIGTPFTLTGSATDPDGNGTLTYSWEQFDLGPQGAPNSPSGTSPIFRSFSPVSSSSRTFPQWSDILNNTQTKGELLPSYSRDLNFRLTVRDNASNGGGVDYGTISFNADDAAGPFVVSVPNTSATYNVNQSLTVQWDVAGTNSAPVNCQNVNILLSTDGGLTYPITLASNTPNDGSHPVNIPNNETTTARIKVEAADNIFFDISNQNFTIEGSTGPDFGISSVAIEDDVCGSTEDVSYTITLDAFSGFNEPVTLTATGLPTGAIASFSEMIVTPPSTVTLTIDVANVTSGEYTFDVTGTSASISHDEELSFSTSKILATAGSLISPSNGAQDQLVKPTFSWSTFSDANSYDLEIAEDMDFINIAHTKLNLTSTNYTIPTSLNFSKTYFWRVRGINSCGDGNYSDSFSFSTIVATCQTYSSEDVPVQISASGTPTVESELIITGVGTIADLNITVDIDHTYINDLDVNLISPANTTVLLVSEICGGEHDLNIEFDDDGVDHNTIPCPAVDLSQAYQANGSLSTFNGEDGSGTWILEVEDFVNEDGGSIEGWSIEICSDVISTATYASLSDIEPQMILFPNPAEEELSIYVSGLLSGNITITNEVGQHLLNAELSATSDFGAEGVLNTSNLNSGIYFVQVQSEGKLIVSKFVKK